MTREESIVKTDEVIRKMKLYIEKYEKLKERFVDIDDSLIGTKSTDFYDVLGATENGNRYELICQKEHWGYIRTIKKNNNV